MVRDFKSVLLHVFNKQWKTGTETFEKFLECFAYHGLKKVDIKTCSCYIYFQYGNSGGPLVNLVSFFKFVCLMWSLLLFSLKTKTSTPKVWFRAFDIWLTTQNSHGSYESLVCVYVGTSQAMLAFQYLRCLWFAWFWASVIPK